MKACPTEEGIPKDLKEAVANSASGEKRIHPMASTELSNYIPASNILMGSKLLKFMMAAKFQKLVI